MTAPFTSSKVPGMLVPIPTLPVLETVILLVLLVLKPNTLASALFTISSFCAFIPTRLPFVEDVIENFIWDAVAIELVLVSVSKGDVVFDIEQAAPELENPLERVQVSVTVRDVKLGLEGKTVRALSSLDFNVAAEYVVPPAERPVDDRVNNPPAERVPFVVTLSHNLMFREFATVPAP